MTRVGSVHDHDPRIVPKLHCNLAVADIDGIDLARAVLQHRVGEATRAGANISANLVR